MTVITVNAPQGRPSLEQRRMPAETPTDAGQELDVMVIDVSVMDGD